MVNKRKMSVLLVAAFSFFILIHGFAFAAEVENQPLRFGVGAMFSPKETLSTYRQILYYIGDHIDRPVKMVQRKSYDEIDQLLRTRDLEIAMICSGPYVWNNRDFGAELLVAPVMYGKPFYHSYLIVHKDAPGFAGIEDFRNKTFAFTDPKSNSGSLAPTYMLARIGETPDSFFSSLIYSGHHGKSIEMVADKQVDGAAVDHLVWEYMNKTNPVYTARTKVVVKSPEFGIPPIVVHPHMDSELKKRIRTILLNMDQDPVGREVLGKIFIDKFIVPPDSNYDAVRQMSDWLEKRKKTK